MAMKCISKTQKQQSVRETVKITPGHDPNDFQCGKRHNLKLINILTEDGHMNHNAGEYAGLKRMDARVAVTKALNKKGLLRGTKPNPMRIGFCMRSKDVVEPVVRPQWWVDTEKIAAPAVKAVEDGDLKFYPDSAKETWYRWLRNTRDWCISRQLWWGHRIPAYLVSVEGQPPPDSSKTESWIAAHSSEEAVAAAASKFGVLPEKISVSQDDDVLDTWFSSGLFPFSVFGWPDETEDFERFYPTSLLETGHDILFFWVARMVMMGLRLTGKLPFKEVMLHSMVRDAHGRKMSKSLGNIVDPIDVIEGITLDRLHRKLDQGNLGLKEVAKAKEGQKKDFPKGIAECGTDAMRFALCAYMNQGRDINLDIDRVIGYRNFCNKIWNATKFVMLKLSKNFVPAEKPQIPDGAAVMDRWILSRLAQVCQACNESWHTYNFSSITSSCYNFFLFEFCDVYLESVKAIFSEGSESARAAAQQTLYTCLECSLRLLHPIMCYVTEELWQRLPRRPGDSTPSIMISYYPDLKTDEYANSEVEKSIEVVQDICHTIRLVNAPYHSAISKSKKKPRVYLNSFTNQSAQLCNKFLDIIQVLSFSSEVTVLLNSVPPADSRCAVEICGKHCEVHSDLKGIVDFRIESEKLRTQKTKLRSEITLLQTRLADPDFDVKCPVNVRTEIKEKEKALLQQVQCIENAIRNFEAVSSE